MRMAVGQLAFELGLLSECLLTDIDLLCPLIQLSHPLQ